MDGTEPADQTCVTAVEPVDVKVRLFVLAEDVEFFGDGRVSVTGAVPEFWPVPFKSRFAELLVVAVLSTSAEAADTNVHCTLRVVSSSDGELERHPVSVLPSTRHEVSVVDDGEVNRPFAARIGVYFPAAAGRYRVELLEDGTDRVLATIPFGVRLLPAEDVHPEPSTKRSGRDRWKQLLNAPHPTS
jgi:hypothetical protein